MNDLNVSSSTCSVLGAGAWGSALAIKLAQNLDNVCLWGRDAKHIQSLQAHYENTAYLPNVQLPSQLTFTHDLDQAILSADHLVLAIPSSAFAFILSHIKSLSDQHQHRPNLLWVCKGFHAEGGLFSDLVQEQGFEASMLSGPSFAKEVAMNAPTAVVIASETQTTASYWQQLFNSPSFRCYTSTDLVGVQVGGACKNIIAIASGAIDGAGLGANARAALLTRGIREVQQLGACLGADAQTFMGLSGIGDLMLTATDAQSRNYQYGYNLATGTAKSTQLAEGKIAAETIMKIIDQTSGHEWPIFQTVHAWLNEEMTLESALDSLMNRPTKKEFT